MCSLKELSELARTTSCCKKITAVLYLTSVLGCAAKVALALLPGLVPGPHRLLGAHSLVSIVLSLIFQTHHMTDGIWCTLSCLRHSPQEQAC